MGGTELRIFSDGSVVRGLVEFDSMGRGESVRGAGGQIDDAEMRQAAFAFEKNEVGLESLHRGKHHLRTIGNNFAPEFSARVANLGGHQAKGSSAGIRSNVKHSVIRIQCGRGFRGKRTWMFRGKRTWMFRGKRTWMFRGKRTWMFRGKRTWMFRGKRTWMFRGKRTWMFRGKRTWMFRGKRTWMF